MARGGARLSVPGVVRPRAALRVLGTSVTQFPEIADAAAKDLGLKIEFMTLDGAEAQRRAALEPDSFDVYDQWFHDIDLIWPTGSLQPIDVTRLPRWDEIGPVAKTGRLSPGHPAAPGGDPSQRLFVQFDGTLGAAASDRISMLPTVHNADTLAVVGAPVAEVTSWGAMLDPAWASRVMLQSDPAIGCLELILAMRARGELALADMGNASLEEIDTLVLRLHGLVASGHLAGTWSDETAAVDAFANAHARGEAMIGSLWWSGFTALRARGVPVEMATPREGYRAWFGGLSLSSRLTGTTAEAAYAYLNWWLGEHAATLMTRRGAYMANPVALKAALSAEDFAFWYDGAPAHLPIRDPSGAIIFRPGARREGGGYAARMSRIAVWDAVMAEHNYLVRRWERALAAAPVRRTA